MTIPRMSDHNRRNLIVGNWSSLVLVATVLTLPSCAVPPIERQLVLAGPTSRTTDDTSDDMRYLLYVPNAHDHPTPVEGWPLILFLHGAFESGNDIARVARHGIPARIEAGDDFPFVVASPQSPRFWRKWPTNALAALLDHVAKHYPIDEDRVYLTGISKGGAATWSTALAYPNRFAAIAPACAFGDPDHIHYIAHVPVWAYHGAKDFLVPPREGERLVNAHRAAGGETRWTLEPGADHGDCGGFYDRDELYTWFLAHRRSAHLLEIQSRSRLSVSADRKFKRAKSRSTQVFGCLEGTDARRLSSPHNGSRANCQPRPTITQVAFLHSQSPEAYLACATASVTRDRATGRCGREWCAELERARRR